MYIDRGKIRVLDSLHRHLQDSILAPIPRNGIHIKPRPKYARADSIELNLIGVISAGGNVIGFTNINMYSEKPEWIDGVYEVVELVMEDALIDRYYFKKDNEYTKHPVSHTLYMGNIAYKFTVDRKLYNRNTGLTR